MAMPFDVAEYLQLVELLYKRPEWRAELRQLLLSDDILTLPQVVRELAEAQKRTEQRVEELAEAQKRTERVIKELFEVQKRSEERISRLEIAVAELAEAQKRTDQKVDRLASELGGLKTLIGASLEEEATAVTETVMRQKGYRLLEEASTLRLNGEVDVILRIEDLQGRQVTVVAEAKTRLSRRDVIAWAQRMHSPGWRKRLQKAGYPGPYWVYAYAIRADTAAKEAIRETGIGLIKGEGEVIAPDGLIE
ncbi:MAG: hypothetical protein Kow0088_09340 [Anaerolineales bacterium]